jgi:hypothetical protein
MTEYAEVYIGPCGGETVVKADGKLVGPVKDVIWTILRALHDAEQMKSPTPDWAKNALMALQSTR